MIVRVSIISLFLVGSPLLGMELVSVDEKPDHLEIELSETTRNTRSITSLQSWQAFAKQNESLDDYEVSPTAVAQFQQKYEIKTDLPVLQEVIDIWSREQWSTEYASEVARMHAFLRYGKEDISDKPEFTALQNTCLKKAYTQLAKTQQELTNEQVGSVLRRRCGIGLTTLAGVLFIAWILEMVFLPRPCPHYY
jgi:hypothetical protein